MRVENKFSIGHVMFEMTMAIQMEMQSKQLDMSLNLGEKFRLNISIFESSAHMWHLKSCEWKGSHGQSVERIDKYFKEK